MPGITHLTLFKDPRFYAAFPAVIALADGTYLLAFRRARDTRWLITDPAAYQQAVESGKYCIDHVDSRSHIALIRLSGSFQRIKELPSLPADPEAADQDASLLAMSNGQILLASFSWYPVPASTHALIKETAGSGLIGDMETTGCTYLFWGGHISVSGDRGGSWSHHHYLPPVPASADPVPSKRPCLGGGIRGAMVEREGLIYLPAYGCRLPHRAPSAHLWVSKDFGKSWSYRSCIATDQTGNMGFCEPSLYFSPAGTLVALMRTLGTDDYLAIARSHDNGHHWSPWTIHNLKGHPWHPLSLPDGRLLLSYGYRHRPYGIRCLITDAEVSTLDQATTFTLNDEAACADIGYPWSALLPDGRVGVAYYFTGQDGIRHIGASLIEI